MEAEQIALSRGWTIGILEPSRSRVEKVSAWFEQGYPSLLRFAYFITADRGAAEDLVQDAFVKIYHAAPDLDDATAPAYARKVIVNLSRSRWRRVGAEQRSLSRVASNAQIDDPGMGAAARDEVWRAIMALSPRQRAVIALRYYEDMSEKQIADVLGMTTGSVKKHTDRAMAKLRDTLGRTA